MLNWLGSLLGLFTGGLSRIWDNFVKVIKTLDGWTEAQISALNARDNVLYLGEFNLSSYIARFVDKVYSPTIALLSKRISDNLKREQDDIARTEGNLNGLRAYVTGQLDAMSLGIAGKFASLIKWIISAVFGPLLSDVTRALGWIEKDGAYVLDLLTHLDKLTTLLLSWLWSGWIGLFRLWFKPLVTYVLHNWRAVLPVLMPVIEDIISSLF